MLWNELLRVAILGTDRGKLSREAVRQLEGRSLVSGAEEKDPALFLLEASAAWQLYRRAGQEPEQFSGAMPPPAQTDDRLLPPAAHPYLDKVLKGVFGPALKELLSYIALKERVVHPRFLPELLDLALDQPDLLPLIRRVSGKRGPWLASQLRNWSPVFPDLSRKQSVQTMNKEILEAMRRQAPREAREWLTQHWKEIPAGKKEEWFGTFSINLSIEDLPFLEERLQERKKAVRLQAAELLVRLSDSGLFNQLAGQLKEWVEIRSTDGKGKLKLKLPEDLLDILANTGLSVSAVWMKEGARKGAFLQAVALLPVSAWMPKDLPPKKAIAVLIRHEWAMELLQAVAQSALLHADLAWQEALLHFWLENYHRDRWNKLDMEPLLKELPRPVLWKVGAAVLPHARPVTEESNPLARLLLARDHLWDKELSLAFFHHFLDWLRNSMRSAWEGWVYRKILTRAAYSCHPGLVDLLSREWPITYAGQWDKDRDRFFRTLRFRREMIQALEG